ncbi:MAG: LytTR family DNA-binding domain-containing protein [Parafilimonas sp.]
MKTIIIEDESLAADRVKLLLHQIDPAIEIVTVLDSIEETVKWFQKNIWPDFIILDIHLSDGSAFHIFEKLHINIPVIFITAFDKYAIDAFKVLSVDYLLKPVTIDALDFAINKLKQFHFNQNPAIDYNKLARFINNEKEIYKSKFLCRIGRKKNFIFSKDVSFFCADNKIVYLVSAEGVRYIVNHSIEDLYSLLDPVQFFRANRSDIINVTFIKVIKPYINNRLQIFMAKGSSTEEIIVSRERVSAFRKWAKN